MPESVNANINQRSGVVVRKGKTEHEQEPDMRKGIILVDEDGEPQPETEPYDIPLSIDDIPGKNIPDDKKIEWCVNNIVLLKGRPFYPKQDQYTDFKDEEPERKPKPKKKHKFKMTPWKFIRYLIFIGIAYLLIIWCLGQFAGWNVNWGC